MTFPQLRSPPTSSGTPEGGLGGIAPGPLAGTEGLLAERRGRRRDPRPEPGTAGCITRRERAGWSSCSCRAPPASATFRLQAALDQEARRAVRPGRQGRAVPERARRGDEEPLELEAVRRVRQVDERPGAAPGRLRRRHGVPARDGLEVERARAGDVHAEHRLRAAGVSRASAPGSRTGWGA